MREVTLVPEKTRSLVTRPDGTEQAVSRYLNTLGVGVPTDIGAEEIPERLPR
jgi:hypothetical protein